MDSDLELMMAFQRGDLGARPLPLRELPSEWFRPSGELEGEGWPDFSPTALADWSSSASPAPSLPNDCCLVLAYTRVIPPIDPAGGWMLVAHETGGIWQEEKRAAVRMLAVAEEGRQIIHAIARAMAQSNCAADFASFDQLAGYRKLLNEYGLDCNTHLQAIAEGFYPIDWDEEALLILQVIEPGAETLELAGTGRACLAVMAPNCSDW